LCFLHENSIRYVLRLMKSVKILTNKSSKTHIVMKVIIQKPLVVAHYIVIIIIIIVRYGRPAVPYTHTTGSELRYQKPTKHTTKYL